MALCLLRCAVNYVVDLSKKDNEACTYSFKETIYRYNEPAGGGGGAS